MRANICISIKVGEAATAGRKKEKTSKETKRKKKIANENVRFHFAYATMQQTMMVRPNFERRSALMYGERDELLNSLPGIEIILFT